MSKSGRTYVNGHKGGGGVLFTKYMQKKPRALYFYYAYGT